jgi:hypothetical protein
MNSEQGLRGIRSTPVTCKESVLISPPAKELPALKNMSFNLIAEDETKFRTYVTEKSSTGFGLKATDVRWGFTLQGK